MVSFVDFDALGCSILEIFHFKAQKQQKFAKNPPNLQHLLAKNLDFLQVNFFEL